MEAKQQKMMQDAEVNKLLSKSKQNKANFDEKTDVPILRDKTRIKNESEEVRMSITEDDDGMPNINLNLIPGNNVNVNRFSENTSQVDSVPSVLTQNVNEFLSNTDKIKANSKLDDKTINPDRIENLNDLFNVTNVISDSINSNVLFNPKPIISENVNSAFQIEDTNNKEANLVQQYITTRSEESKQEGLFCDSSVSFSKAKVRSQYGHSSDSNIQTLLYDSNKNKNIQQEKSSTERMNLKNEAARQICVELKSENREIKTINEEMKCSINEYDSLIGHNIKGMSKSESAYALDPSKNESVIGVDRKENTDVDQMYLDIVTRDGVDSELLSHVVNNAVSTGETCKF